MNTKKIIKILSIIPGILGFGYSMDEQIKPFENTTKIYQWTQDFENFYEKSSEAMEKILLVLTKQNDIENFKQKPNQLNTLKKIIYFAKCQ